MVRSRRMRWTMHVTHKGSKGRYGILIGKPGGKIPHIGGRIILKLFLGSRVVWYGLD
jgi:hypothetical protein